MPKLVKKEEKQVIYPEPTHQFLYGEQALTVDKAKELLGWEEVENKDDACVPEISTLLGKNVRLRNNCNNRYLTLSWLLELKHRILAGKWRKNLDQIVIGNCGNVQSGQHRLIALILASEEWKDKECTEYQKWQKLWPTEPTLETAIAFGADESDEVFFTLNGEKPGTVSEALYRCEFFKKHKPQDRKVLARMADYATKLLWSRLGTAGKDDAFVPRRSPAEVMDFLIRHPRLVKDGAKWSSAVRHIWEDNKSNGEKLTREDGSEYAAPNDKIQQYLSCGYAAAMLYLMGCSASDGETYRKLDPPTEKKLDWSRWDKAQEFWTLLASQSPDVSDPVDEAMESLREAHDKAGGLTIEDRLAILGLAWTQFAQGKPISKKDLKLEYLEERADDGSILSYTLVDNVTVGGIDCGRPQEKEENEEPEAEPTPPPAPKPVKKPKEGGDPKALTDEAARKKRVDEIAAELERRRRAEKNARVTPHSGRQAQEPSPKEEKSDLGILSDYILNQT